ncbi:uncharacterized protein BJ171DRAFT_495433 [Polychytrium aggregatum]|uniref:uncharacterized protein n=1 Tax=Polychytrium aggregatum TaxID=110093 RepID=UPI0022FF1866|nr:uncharacterized protein BJ171DRAFT_495433 [Polychytrium aggregatum]KAI9207007.1 hypothetical protein BJ171DRAFT_495433 [Polychytrium aggregatum]
MIPKFQLVVAVLENILVAAGLLIVLILHSSSLYSSCSLFTYLVISATLHCIYIPRIFMQYICDHLLLPKYSTYIQGLWSVVFVVNVFTWLVGQWETYNTAPNPSPDLSPGDCASILFYTSVALIVETYISWIAWIVYELLALRYGWSAAPPSPEDFTWHLPALPSIPHDDTPNKDWHQGDVHENLPSTKVAGVSSSSSLTDVTAIGKHSRSTTEQGVMKSFPAFQTAPFSDAYKKSIELRSGSVSQLPGESIILSPIEPIPRTLPGVAAAAVATTSAQDPVQDPAQAQSSEPAVQ